MIQTVALTGRFNTSTRATHRARLKAVGLNVVAPHDTRAELLLIGRRPGDAHLAMCAAWTVPTASLELSEALLGGVLPSADACTPHAHSVHANATEA